MRLLNLTLEQYRNYEKLSMEFPETNLQLFIGSNGSGKTNILEAIGLLSLTKSFLGLEEDHLRQWGTEFYRVRGTFQTDAGETGELEVVSELSPRRQKACFVSGVRMPVAAVVGRMPVVTFLPQDLSLFSGPPAERRRMLDQLLCQVSSEYFMALMEYQRVLKQRNALLRSIAEGSARTSDLGVWDTALAEKGELLISMRKEMMETWNLTLGEEVAALGESWEEIQMIYQTHELPLRQALSENVARDVIVQSTTVGPHRDDWMILANGRALSNFASRGQQRVAVLALLFLAASYLELRRGERPIILLDDIFSELDAEHRERLVTSFTGHQVFLTATELPVEHRFPGTVRMIENSQVYSKQ